MTNALADSDVCKDSTAAGVLAKEGGGEREIGGREEGRKTIGERPNAKTVLSD